MCKPERETPLFHLGKNFSPFRRVSIIPANFGRYGHFGQFTFWGKLFSLQRSSSPPAPPYLQPACLQLLSASSLLLLLLLLFSAEALSDSLPFLFFVFFLSFLVWVPFTCVSSAFSSLYLFGLAGTFQMFTLFNSSILHFGMNFTLLVYLFIYYLKWYFFRFHISIIIIQNTSVSLLLLLILRLICGYNLKDS